ncbi:hypothetical protein M422DRAFT_45790 [Sphaerobolus stellatus SS14]|nr:hypothetical protein M422DRAFT_45790 [Sphaerobolus stellatus SS14]
MWSDNPSTDSFTRLLPESGDNEYVNGSSPSAGKIPKQDVPQLAQLGVPQQHKGDTPPKSLEFHGIEMMDSKVVNSFLSGHSSVKNHEKVQISTVLYSPASPNSRLPKYHNQAKITGEVRLNVLKPTHISTIEVWLIGNSDSNLRPDYSFLHYRANIWNKSIKTHIETSMGIVQDKFPVGSYTFPFEFEELPEFTQVSLPADGPGLEIKPNTDLSYFTKGSVGYSSSIAYRVWTHIAYGRIWTPVVLESPIVYYPRIRPLPKAENTFPREISWPLQREEINGWSITPFTGKGHFSGEMVEIEGLLMVQAPLVYAMQQQVEFVLLLRSTSQAALQALSVPDHINVAFMSSDIYGRDALQPGNAADKSRVRKPLAKGRISINNEDHHCGKDVVRLDGDVTVPIVLPPSFRYELIGREYLINILITHPNYLHESPAGKGIETELPLWIVTDPPSARSGGPAASPTQLGKLPIIGDPFNMGDLPKRAPSVTGKATDDGRPAIIGKRFISF